MERWEPSRKVEEKASRRRPRMPQFPKRVLPEIWLMVALRVALFLVFAATVVIDDLRVQMQFVVLAVVAGLIAVVLQSNEGQTHALRRQAMLDLAILVTVVPIAVLNGFVSAEPGDMLPAEQSALFQTAGGLFIALILVIWLGSMLFPGDRTLLPALLLPALTLLVALTFVLHDYRNQTVLAMLAVSFFIGAAAIALGTLVGEPVRRYVPAIFFGSTIFAGLILFDPGLGSVFDRDGLVQMFTGLMILIATGALLIIPNPSLEMFRFPSGAPRRRGSRPRPQRRHDRDPGGDTENRG